MSCVAKMEEMDLMCWFYSINPIVCSLSGSLCLSAQCCWLTNWQIQDLNVVFPVPIIRITATVGHLYLSGLVVILPI